MSIFTGSKNAGSRGNKQGWQALILLLPVLIGFALFYIYPTLRGVALSFTNTSDLATVGDNVGFSNYVKAFQDPIFWNAILQNCNNTSWLAKYKVTHGTDNQTN